MRLTRRIQKSETGHGRHLSDAEVSVIHSLRKQEKSQRYIEKEVRHSRGVILNALKCKRTTIKTKRSGRPRKLTRTCGRAIVRAAASSFMTACELRNWHVPQVSVRTVQRLVQNAAHLGWMRVKRVPPLTPFHKNAREKWSRWMLSTSPSTLRARIWSYDKRFNLDGPDGFQHF